jgi:chromosome segregation ATPase
MLKKLKITTYVFILCLFGLTLITVSPVKAEDVPDRARDFQSELQLCDRSLDESMVAYEAIRQSLAVLEGENVTCVAESRTLTEQLTAANAQYDLSWRQLTAANAETGSLREQLTAANAETGSLREQLTAANAEMGPLREQVTVANAETGSLREQLTAANAETGSLREQLTAANAETGSLREQLTAANAEMGPLREQVILANADRDHCRTSEGDGSLRLTRRVSPVRSGQTAREYAEMCIIDICVNPR